MVDPEIGAPDPEDINAQLPQPWEYTGRPAEPVLPVAPEPEPQAEPEPEPEQVLQPPRRQRVPRGRAPRLPDGEGAAPAGLEGPEDYRGLIRRRGERWVPPVPIQEPGEQDFFPFLVLFGGQLRWIRIPLNQQGRPDFKAYMREVMDEVERRLGKIERGSATAIKQDELNYVILEMKEGHNLQYMGSALRARLGDIDLKRDADEIQEEQVARATLHSAFGTFETAESMKAVGAAARELKGRDLNVLFKLEPIQRALQMYEDRMEYFLYGETGVPDPEIIEADPERKKILEREQKQALARARENFRLEIQKELARGAGMIMDRMGEQEQLEQAKKFAWGQRNAERLLAITGRLTARDPSARTGWSTGNFWMQRALVFNNWVKKYEKQGLFPELVEHLDLEQQDFFRFMAGDFEERGWLMPGKTAKDFLRNTGQDKLGKVDFSTVDWSKVDFEQYGVEPLNDWIYRYVEKPDNVVTELTKNYLFNPNEQNLNQMSSEFRYQDDKGWKAKETLARDLLAFVTSNKYARKTGRPKYSYERVMGIINTLGGYLDEDKPGFLRVEQRKRLVDDISNLEEGEENGAGRRRKRFHPLTVFLNRYEVRFAEGLVKGFFLGLLQFVLKSAFGGKK